MGELVERNAYEYLIKPKASVEYTVHVTVPKQSTVEGGGAEPAAVIVTRTPNDEIVFEGTPYELQQLADGFNKVAEHFAHVPQKRPL